MTEHELLESARALPRVSPETASVYADRAEAMAAAVSARMLARGDIQELVGPCNMVKMLDNHRTHARFISGILSEFEPALLVRTLAWVLHSHRSDGFTPHYFKHQIEAWLPVLGEHLKDGDLEEIMPLYEWLQDNMEHFIRLSDRKLYGN